MITAASAKGVRHTRSVGIGVCVGLLLVLALVRFPIPSASGETLGTWNPTTSWKNSDLSAIADPSCATYDGDIYCVGGYLGEGVAQDGVEYAQVSSLVSSPGASNWMATMSYPTGFDGGSCAIDSSIGYIYCVGGSPGGGEFTANVYYAQLSASGGVEGGWTSTTAYPYASVYQSCAIDSSLNYIYCIGGSTDTSFPTTPDNVEEWAPVSASGVGTWSGGDFITEIDGQSCNVSSGYIYCVGGFELPEGAGAFTQADPSQAVYYAATSTSGLEWAATTEYPIDIGNSACGIASGYVYCVGGEEALGGEFTDNVYYATVGSSGIGAWASTSSYPGEEGIELASCGISGGDMVCVGGLGGTEFITGSVNYASINGYESTTSSSTTSGSAPPLQPVCPNTYGGILMPVGATFTDSYGNTWVAPGGYIDGDVLTSYFFQDSYTVAPLPMLEGWGGMYGTYNGEQGWIITFYCS